MYVRLPWWVSLCRCTEQFQPFSRDGVHDMYWDQARTCPCPFRGHQSVSVLSVRRLPALQGSLLEVG